MSVALFGEFAIVPDVSVTSSMSALSRFVNELTPSKSKTPSTYTLFAYMSLTGLLAEPMFTVPTMLNSSTEPPGLPSAI